MYGKIFASLYQGTLRGNAHAILVFTNLIACADRHGQVDKHWRAVADEVGLSVDQVRAAIAFLESPDEESRSREHDGARLVRLSDDRGWGWQIVNYRKYRDIRNEEDRTEQNRAAQERTRARRADSKKVSQRQPASSGDASMSAKGDGDAHAKAEAASVEPRARIEANETTTTPPPSQPVGLFDPKPKTPATTAVAPQMPRTARTLSPADLRAFGLSIVSPDDSQAVELALLLYGQDNLMDQLRKTVAATASASGPVYPSALLADCRKRWVLLVSDYQRAGLDAPDGTPEE